MLFFFWKVTKIFFEYLYQYLPLPEAVTQILDLSVPPEHDISGKKISSLSCFIFSGTWVKILIRLGNLFHLWYFFPFLFFFNLIKLQAVWVDTLQWEPSLGLLNWGQWVVWAMKVMTPLSLEGILLYSPQGLLAGLAVLLILLGLAWLRKGFFLKIDSW